MQLVCDHFDKTPKHLQGLPWLLECLDLDVSNDCVKHNSQEGDNIQFFQSPTSFPVSAPSSMKCAFWM